MKNFNLGIHSITVLGLGLGLMAFTGCGENDHSEHADTSTPSSTEEVHDEHPTEGPHEGGLVELGEEEYHIEIVHDDDAGTVTAYVLDSTAKLAVPIEASEIIVNLSHDGQAEQFVLAASPQSDDPVGKSSRYVSSDGELAEDLDNEAITAQLVVTINGKQYRAAIQHDGEHEGHDEHEGEAEGHE